MKNQQSSEELLKQMANSKNLSAPEFERMMKEDHGLVPPVELDEDYDYSDDYVPPERTTNALILDPEESEEQIAFLRGKMLEPTLSRYNLDKLAFKLGQHVASSGELDSRMIEIEKGVGGLF